jgi:hypothetical protein
MREPERWRRVAAERLSLPRMRRWTRIIFPIRNVQGMVRSKLNSTLPDHHVPRQRLSHTKHSDVAVGKGVLQQAASRC